MNWPTSMRMMKTMYSEQMACLQPRAVLPRPVSLSCLADFLLTYRGAGKIITVFSATEMLAVVRPSNSE